MGGIRPGVWLAAGLAVAVSAAAIGLALAPGGATTRDSQPGPESTEFRPTPPVAAAPARPALPMGPAASSHDAPTAPAVFGAGTSGVPAGRRADPQPPPRREGGVPALPDSRLAADLRVLEEEAARRMPSYGFGAPSAATTPGPAAVGAPEGDAALAKTSDAFLVDSLVQEALRSTEYPIGYPAEARERAAAQAQVSALTPELESALLQRFLDLPPQAPVKPQFLPPESGQVWPGAVASSPAGSPP
jgi:hypothetical protein